ncbi:MAG: response regulator [Thermodesulfobacteriota bacterium]
MTKANEKRILIVDDEPDVRNFLATLIQDAGFQTETAVDGVDALEKIQARIPDLMTLDMVMPRKSGLRLIRTIKQDERWAGIPIIVITAHAHDEFGNEDIREFNAFTSNMRPRYIMEKPVTPEKLIKAICEILQVEPAGDMAGDTRTRSVRDEVFSLLGATDGNTLKKVRELLKNG